MNRHNSSKYLVICVGASGVHDGFSVRTTLVPVSSIVLPICVAGAEKRKFGSKQRAICASLSNVKEMGENYPTVAYGVCGYMMRTPLVHCHKLQFRRYQ